jgi:hypothetical protein
VLENLARAVDDFLENLARAVDDFRRFSARVDFCCWAGQGFFHRPREQKFLSRLCSAPILFLAAFSIFVWPVPALLANSLFGPESSVHSISSCCRSSVSFLSVCCTGLLSPAYSDSISVRVPALVYFALQVPPKVTDFSLYLGICCDRELMVL